MIVVLLTTKPHRSTSSTARSSALSINSSTLWASRLPDQAQPQFHNSARNDNAPQRVCLTLFKRPDASTIPPPRASKSSNKPARHVVFGCCGFQRSKNLLLRLLKTES